MLARSPCSAQHVGMTIQLTLETLRTRKLSAPGGASGVLSSLSSAQVKCASRSRLTVALRPPRRPAALACCRRLGVRCVTGVCACSLFLPDAHLHNAVSG